MMYRHTLIARSLQFQSQQDEPAVLDYLQLRNRQCLHAWRLKRMKYARNVAAAEPQPQSRSAGVA